MTVSQTAKHWLVDHTGLAKDALHIYVALLLFFASMAVFGWRASSIKPVLLVAAAALIGEAWDFRDVIVTQAPIMPSYHWHDLWNTMFWPVAIWALARWTRLLR